MREGVSREALGFAGSHEFDEGEGHDGEVDKLGSSDLYLISTGIICVWDTIKGMVLTKLTNHCSTTEALFDTCKKLSSEIINTTATQ